MKATGKVIGWICIVSTLSGGCYSWAMVDPSGDNKERIYQDRIDYVLTRDSTEYEFDKPAKADSSAIVGEIDGKQVSIPLSEVSQVRVRPFNLALTIVSGFLASTVLFFLILGTGVAMSGSM